MIVQCRSNPSSTPCHELGRLRGRALPGGISTTGGRMWPERVRNPEVSPGFRLIGGMQYADT